MDDIHDKVSKTFCYDGGIQLCSKKSLRASKSNFVKNQGFFNPDLTTSYLKISSMHGSVSSVAAKNGLSLPALDISAKPKRIYKKFYYQGEEHKISLKDLKNAVDGRHRFIVFPGNNSEIIRNIMSKRPNWDEASHSDFMSANFVWHPLSSRLRFDRLLPYLPIQVVNHFEFHNEISNKKNLYNNLFKFCKEKNLSISDIMPKNFVIDFDSKFLHSEIMLFVCFYKSLKKKGASNYWIFKPSGLNRGKEIHVFKSLKVFKVLLENASKRRTDLKSVIVQKYLEKPLLINQRKFDIRVWVLITHDYKCYFCKNGYIRTSSEKFSLNDSTISNEYIHLTNNAIQKNGSQYGKFEEGNQLSLNQLEYHLPLGSIKLPDIIKRMKEIITFTLLSVKKKLNPNKRQHCFEIFGYDFIIDEELKVWLIECNTNPCLEISSKALANIIPKMLNQAFCLTIDKIFPDENNPLIENPVWEFLTILQR